MTDKKSFKFAIALIAVVILALGAVKGYESFSGNNDETGLSDITVIYESESSPDSETETQSEPEIESDTSERTTKQRTTSVRTTTKRITTTKSSVNRYRFRNYNLLNSHYEKHGKEMGFSSAEAYENAASAVVTNPNALHKTEKEDGDDVYYIVSTNEFVVVSKDGYIRTYFKPDSGKKYFDKQ